MVAEARVVDSEGVLLAPLPRCINVLGTLSGGVTPDGRETTGYTLASLRDGGMVERGNDPPESMNRADSAWGGWRMVSWGVAPRWYNAGPLALNPLSWQLGLEGCDLIARQLVEASSRLGRTPTLLARGRKLRRAAALQRGEGLSVVLRLGIGAGGGFQRSRAAFSRKNRNIQHSQGV